MQKLSERSGHAICEEEHSAADVGQGNYNEMKLTIHFPTFHDISFNAALF